MYYIRQIFDKNKKKYPSIKDLQKWYNIEPVFKEEVVFMDEHGREHIYDLYERPSEQLDMLTLKDRKKVSTKIENPPFQTFEMDNGKRKVKVASIAQNLWEKWGNGAYNYQWIGGNENPLETFFCKTYIHKRKVIE